MNVEFRAISYLDLHLYARPEDVDELWNFARFSDPLFAGMYMARCGCLIGFIPETRISDRAYVWLNDLPWFKEHPVVAALAARRMIKLAQLRYTTLFGHCGQHSVKWLRSLGAEINFPDWVIHV